MMLNLKSTIRHGAFAASLMLSASALAGQTELKAFLAENCGNCHGAEKQKGDRRFDTISFDLANDVTLGEWQDILDLINLGEMPPEDKPQPKPEALKVFVAEVTEMIRVAQENHRAVRAETVLRRLNNREYRNTIRDLLHLDMSVFNPTKGFPDDDAEDGFDNLGETLVTSEHLLGKYLDAADKVIEKAIHLGPRPEVQKWSFLPPFDRTTGEHSHWVTQERYKTKEFQSIFQGTHERFGYRPLDDIKEGVPHDGYYKIRVKAAGLHREHVYDDRLIGTDQQAPIRLALVAGSQEFGTLHLRQSIEKTLAVFDLPDNDPEWHEARIWLDKGYQTRLTYENGPYFFKSLPNPIHRMYPDIFPIKLNFRNWWEVCQNIHTPQIRVYAVEMEGPFYEEWPTQSHQAIFGDQPFAPERTREIIANFATKAFRRPATGSEISSLMALVEKRRELGESPLEALKVGLKAILCSPSFLYLDNETTVVSAGAGATETRLTDHALASRLSYYLWSTIPDERLLQLADEGRLSDRETLLAETKRMLSDPRAEGFVANFTDRWLSLYKLGEMPPDSNKFKDYYVGNLEPAMRAETHVFFRHLLQNNLSLRHFLDSDFTFVNRALARHYGMDPEKIDFSRGSQEGPGSGNRFVKVALNGGQRGGLFGQASVLTATANGIDTSPVIRGVWVLEKILGTPPSPPPPDVEPLEPDIRGAKSIRDQLAKHRDNATCYECHRKIDPLGFALESFDAIGSTRNSYGRGVSIDTSGEMPDGKSFQDIRGMKQVLLAREDQFSHCLAEKLLTYATGRQLTVRDRPHLDQITHALKQQGGGLRDLVLLTVQSETFLSK